MSSVSSVNEVNYLHLEIQSLIFDCFSSILTIFMLDDLSDYIYIKSSHCCEHFESLE